jgi:hypothetical protein
MAAASEATATPARALVNRLNEFLMVPVLSVRRRAGCTYARSRIPACSTILKSAAPSAAEEQAGTRPQPGKPANVPETVTSARPAPTQTSKR